MRLRQGDLFGATRELSDDPLLLDRLATLVEDDDDDSYDVPQLYLFRTAAPRKPTKPQ